MAINSYKSAIYNRKNLMTDDNAVIYDKVFLYDEVKEKLRHNLTVMPKDEIDGAVYIWKFNNNKVDMLKMDMKERYADWKHEYNSFIGGFTAKAYIYYISTLDEKRNKHYRTIIALIPKKASFDILEDMIENTDIEDFIKNSFIKKLEEQIG